jgi:fructokinase
VECAVHQDIESVALATGRVALCRQSERPIMPRPYCSEVAVIVTCGEALVDLVPEGPDGDSVYRPVLGGSLYNVALGIARLGGRSGYLWELSSDALGQRLLTALARDGVDTAAVLVSARATPVAIVDFSGAEPRYNIADPDRVMLDTTPPPLPPAAGCLVIGSAVLAREPVADAIEARAGEAPLLAIDYNVRPPSVRDRAAYKARLVRLSQCGGIVKASEADLASLGEDDPEDFMARLTQAGAAIAVLTRGAGGATVLTERRRESVASIARSIVDPVGAGDAFMAGLLTWLQRRDVLTTARLKELEGADLQDLLVYAQAVAAATCASRGAVMPFARDLAPSGVAGSAIHHKAV